MVLWSIWKSRNVKLWEGNDTSSAVTVARAKDILNEWSCTHRAKLQHSGTSQPCAWTKPQHGIIKCNVMLIVPCLTTIHSWVMVCALETQ